MAEQNEQNDFTITVNDKDFKFNDLSDENKALVAHIRDLEGQLNQVGFRHEQLSASKNFSQISWLHLCQSPKKKHQQKHPEASE